ncbi:MAG: HAD family hydrolase [Oscillospiraceae bacterium]
MKKAIIFDLDGTLWDSSQSVTDSWNEILKKYPEARQITLGDMHGFMGRQMDEIARMIMPDLPDNRRLAIMDECMDFELTYLKEHCGATLYPKVCETLEILRETSKLMIVSNCQDGYIQTFLEFSRLGELFDDFESAGATGLSKGENNKLVIARNRIDRAIYVGDTQGDLDSADFAGIPFVHAAYGFGKINRQTARANSFEEIPNIVKEIFGE